MKRITLFLMALLLVFGSVDAQTSKKKSTKKVASPLVEGKQKVRQYDVQDSGDSLFYSINKFTQFNTKAVKFYYIPFDYTMMLSLSSKSNPDWGAMKPVMNFLEMTTRASLQMCFVYAVNPEILDATQYKNASKKGADEALTCLNNFKAWMTAHNMRNKSKFQVAEIDYRYFKGNQYYDEGSNDDVIHVGLFFYFGTKKKNFFPDPNDGVKTFPDIKFFLNDATIVESYAATIDELATYLKQNDRKGVLLTGHTDNVGTPQYLEGLSKQRAMEVKKALMMRGILSNRIEIETKADGEPKGDNNTYEGRVSNNRVSIKIQ